MVKVLRFLKSNLDNAVKEKRSKLTDEEVIAIIRKRLKQGQEAKEKFLLGNRQDLVESEQKEMDIIARYLPKQLSTEELKLLVEKIALELEAKGAADFGRVMKAVIKEVGGRADGRTVKEIVEKALSQF